ncbi:uncharacterized protein DFL_009256 [Arthrobotrys flagrans]|uniref:Uncharacterized protein n=1 Tax=Arthrobotrys flagrans TaxID=97331 RepID=A0A436ZR44_ARTFL|nr:hypothetical protein DFL_009256 [Arthrobotrys flagrans]
MSDQDPTASSKGLRPTAPMFTPMNTTTQASLTKSVPASEQPPEQPFGYVYPHELSYKERPKFAPPSLLLDRPLSAHPPQPSSGHGASSEQPPKQLPEAARAAN